MGARGGGGSSPRGSKRPNDAEMGAPQGKSPSHQPEGSEVSRESELPEDATESRDGGERATGEVDLMRMSPARRRAQNTRDG